MEEVLEEDGDVIAEWGGMRCSADEPLEEARDGAVP
jgi:hypothetical protein